jgi:hypothetical protein
MVAVYLTQGQLRRVYQSTAETKFLVKGYQRSRYLFLRFQTKSLRDIGSSPSDPQHARIISLNNARPNTPRNLQHPLPNCSGIWLGDWLVGQEFGFPRQRVAAWMLEPQSWLQGRPSHVRRPLLLLGRRERFGALQRGRL